MEPLAGIASVLHSYYFMAILALVAGDFVTGVGSAHHRGVFSWERLGDIFPKNVVAALGALALQIAGAIGAPGGLDAVIDAGTFAVLTSMIGKSMVNNLDEMQLPLVGVFVTWVLGWLEKIPGSKKQAGTG